MLKFTRNIKLLCLFGHLCDTTNDHLWTFSYVILDVESIQITYFKIWSLQNGEEWAWFNQCSQLAIFYEEISIFLLFIMVFFSIFIQRK